MFKYLTLNLFFVGVKCEDINGYESWEAASCKECGDKYDYLYESNPDVFSVGYFCSGDDCSWNFDLDECQAKGKYSSIKNCKILPRLLGFELQYQSQSLLIHLD